MAKEQGLSLTSPDGLLKQFTKTVLETALNEEMTEHLGCAKRAIQNRAPPAPFAGMVIRNLDWPVMAAEWSPKAAVLAAASHDGQVWSARLP
ncbi:hypothetical protein AB0368_36640 [Actinoplanes sp. NPDC051475]|uniref:hypothetical protein n=1 Tax=Actinoplanes sp. NPDC051475 TaxID=3157225 RepID=UPI00344D361D